MRTHSLRARSFPAVAGLGLGILVNLSTRMVPTASAADVRIDDFQGNGYAWKPTGTAFQRGPASGAMLKTLEIENDDGSPVISSEVEGDGPQGTLTSPAFKISEKYLGFRIGGGNYERHSCLNLLIDGHIVRSATGWKSDHLTPMSWNVSAWQGQTAQVQIVDEASGDWGHLNVNHIVLTANPEAMPVETGALYAESLRPQFHFTARQWTVDRLNPGQRQEGWINDLNGLIYYEGEYHLFAQRWAKCWLHAVSTDLIHWKELAPAFWEESLGSGVQSGTCVIDYANTSGLSPNPATPPMVAFWSRFDNHSQCLAYSLDRGRTWKMYEKNPLMDMPERDPNVFWYAPGKHWVMVLYGDGQYKILTSKNLLEWKDEHHPIPNSFECPDLFELAVDGDRSAKKWVLIQGNGNYSVGSFDGAEFKEETPRRPCDIGPNFYATQSWHNTDTGDGRRIQTAWMRGANFVDMPFSQMISFPCEMTLHKTAAGFRLFRKPISEIERLHRSQDTWTNVTLPKGRTLPLEAAGQLFHLVAEVSIPQGAKLILNIRGNQVVLTDTTIQSGNGNGTVEERVKKIEVLVDRASIESFVNDGEISATRYALPTESGLSAKAEGGDVEIRSLTIYPLDSAWSVSK